VGALAFERLTLFRQLPTSFAQLIQADGFRLIGVEQPSVGADQPVEVRLQLLFGRLFTVGLRRGTGCQASVLRQELLRIGKEGEDMIPDRIFQPIAVDLRTRTGSLASCVNAILTGTAIIASFATSACPPHDPMHRKTAGAAGEQTAQQMVVLLIVPERQHGIACQLRLGAIPPVLVDDGRHRNGNPLFLRSQPATPLAAVARLANGPRLGGGNVFIAVGIGGTAINRIGKNVMHDRR